MLKHVPGFRTGKLWKKFISFFAYIILTMLFFAIIKGDSLSDSVFGFLIYLFVFIFPIALITNFLDVRNRLPLFQKKNIGGYISGSILYIFSTFVGIIIAASVLLDGNTQTVETKIENNKEIVTKEIVTKEKLTSIASTENKQPLKNNSIDTNSFVDISNLYYSTNKNKELWKNIKGQEVEWPPVLG
jgi:heme/copper-type cytochrome/quinol oxidase subunit 4